MCVEIWSLEKINTTTKRCRLFVRLAKIEFVEFLAGEMCDEHFHSYGNIQSCISVKFESNTDAIVLFSRLVVLFYLI